MVSLDSRILITRGPGLDESQFFSNAFLFLNIGNFSTYLRTGCSNGRIRKNHGKKSNLQDKVEYISLYKVSEQVGGGEVSMMLPPQNTKLCIFYSDCFAEFREPELRLILPKFN